MDSKPARMGSYPYRYIAEDYGLPYGTVLCYADSVTRHQGMPANSYWQLAARHQVDERLSPEERAGFHAAVEKQVEVMRVAHQRPQPVV